MAASEAFLALQFSVTRKYIRYVYTYYIPETETCVVYQAKQFRVKQILIIYAMYYGKSAIKFRAR